MFSLKRITFWSSIAVLVVVGAISYFRSGEISFCLTPSTRVNITLKSGNIRLIVVSRYAGPTYPEEPSIEKVTKCWSGVPPRVLGFDSRVTNWVVSDVRFGHVVIELNLLLAAVGLAIIYTLIRFLLSNTDRARRVVKEILHPSGPRCRVRRTICRTTALTLLASFFLVALLAIEKQIGPENRVSSNFFTARLDAGRPVLRTPLEAVVNRFLSSQLNCVVQARSGQVTFGHVWINANSLQTTQVFWRYAGFSFGSSPGRHYLADSTGHFPAPGSPPVEYWTDMVTIPLVVLLPLLLLFPIVLFLRGPWRRSRLHREGCCLHCSYDLTGLTEPRCPECGTPFKKTLPAVSSERPASYSSK